MGFLDILFSGIYAITDWDVKKPYPWPDKNKETNDQYYKNFWLRNKWEDHWKK